MECGALGQNGHLVETPVVAGFDTENGSVTTLRALTIGYYTFAADFSRLDAIPDIFVQVIQITFP